MLRIFVLALLFCHSLAFARTSVLNEIVARVALQAPGTIPIVISDLDETLVDSSTRRLVSYREAASTLCGTTFTVDCEKIAGINVEEFLTLPNRYDQNPLFDNLGVSKGAWRKNLTSLAIDIYLSGRNLDLDQSVPGGTEYIRDLKRAGAKVFFVSSRFNDVQREGTLRSLANLGIWEAGSPEEVILRPRGLSSIDFKRNSFTQIKEWASENNGEILLVMENEPENMNAMTEIFPDASAVFVEGAFARYEPLLGTPIKVKNFR